MLVPVLYSIISNASAGSLREILLSMAYRGRLNVLTHVLG